MTLTNDKDLLAAFDDQMMQIQSSDWDSKRGEYIRNQLLAAGSQCGKELSVGFGALLEFQQSGYAFGDRVRLGCYCYLGPKSRNLDVAYRFEDGVVLEPYVSMSANQHLYGDETKNYKAGNRGRTIHIKHNARVESRSTILAGVTVGVSAIVRAGSVVTKDVPDYAIVEGIPARVVELTGK